MTIMDMVAYQNNTFRKDDNMKRIYSLLLALVMVFGLLPVTALAADDTEPNDTLPTAQEFTICDTINGSISEEGCVDWYKFTLEESGRVTLKMTSYMQYYTLSFYNWDGEPIWIYHDKEWDPTAGMRTDSYSTDITEGTYYIRVTGHKYIQNVNYSPLSTGKYVLKTDYVNANATEIEENDTIAQSNTLPLNSSINGQIAINDDPDFYQIELPASGRLNLDLTAYMNYVSIALYNEDGNMVWSDHDNTWDTSSHMQHLTYPVDLIEGIYYVKITGHKYIHNVTSSPTCTGNYTLRVDYINANTNEVEPNNSFSDAQWVSPNKQIIGQIATNDSLDFFKFTLTRNMALTLDFNSYMAYYSLQIYDETGNRIWYDLDNGWDPSAQSRHDLYTINLAKGTYTLSVLCDRYANGAVTSTGNYSFKLNTENPFKDTPAGSFYYDSVLWAVEQGITSGTDATHFSPNGKCQRAHVVTFLWRAAGSPAPKSADNPFVDVKPADFYYKAVLWAVENGITTGTNATHFSPNGICNRAQVVTFLWRAQEKPAPTSTEHPFTDVTKGQFYYEAMLWAVENEITNGLTATTFGPNAACNRAQVVTFLWRAMAE